MPSVGVPLCLFNGRRFFFLRTTALSRLVAVDFMFTSLTPALCTTHRDHNSYLHTVCSLNVRRILGFFSRLIRGGGCRWRHTGLTGGEHFIILTVIM